VEAARHFQLAPIGLIIVNVNYSDTSITSAALIPDHYPPFNHAGTVMRHVRLPDVKRDVSDVEMKIVTERRLKIADRTYSSSAHGGMSFSYVHPKSYNSLYYSDECDPVLIDTHLKGFSDAIAQNSTCTVQNSIYAR